MVSVSQARCNGDNNPVLKQLGDTHKLKLNLFYGKMIEDLMKHLKTTFTAKLRMLEFYYDFVDKYIDQHDLELIQMDADSIYMAI